MANLIKIRDVQLYVGRSSAQDLADSYVCTQILKGVPAKITDYGTAVTIHRHFFKSLEDCVFGADCQHHTFTRFPIIIWQECYDDYERWLSFATSSHSLATSNLVKYKNLVQS